MDVNNNFRNKLDAPMGRNQKKLFQIKKVNKQSSRTKQPYFISKGF